MKRLSAAFEQVLLGNTAYCRRPPRPKPNENPSPYVVRLSLCYGIGKTQHAPLWFSPRFAASGKILRFGVCRKTSPLSVLAEKSARRILAVTLGKMRFCRALFYYSHTFAKSLVLALSRSYFNAVNGWSATRSRWLTAARKSVVLLRLYFIISKPLQRVLLWR